MIRKWFPVLLSGFKRIVFLVLYVVIVSSSIGGLIYTFYVSPLFGLIVLPICYVFNNLLFLNTHSRLHASFIELREAEMNVLCHHAFIHHYRNISVFHETWLETRVCSRTNLRDQICRERWIFVQFLSVFRYQSRGLRRYLSYVLWISGRILPLIHHRISERGRSRF